MARSRAVSLAAYGLKIFPLRSEKSEIISNFAGGHDFIELFDQYLRQRKKSTSLDEDARQVLRVKRIEKDSRRIYGLIDTGVYGLEGPLFDVEKDEVVYNSQATEAKMYPFYFLMKAPKGADEAILILQRTGAYGIRQILYEDFGAFFKQRYESFRIEFCPLVDKKEIEKYQRGKIEEVRWISFDIPSDVTDCYESGHNEKLGHMEIVIRANRGKFFPLRNHLQKVFSGKQTPKGFVALRDFKNFKIQEVKVKSRVGGTTRTLDLGDWKHLRSYFDVSNRAKIEKSGHPKFDSIHDLGEEILHRIEEEIYKK